MTVKLPSVCTQRSVSQENAFERAKNLQLLFLNNFKFKTAKFEFNVTVHYDLWGKTTSCDQLRCNHFVLTFLALWNTNKQKTFYNLYETIIYEDSQQIISFSPTDKHYLSSIRPYSPWNFAISSATVTEQNIPKTTIIFQKSIVTNNPQYELTDLYQRNWTKNELFWR